MNRFPREKAKSVIRGDEGKSTLKLRLFVQTPSLTEIVITEAPVWLAIGLIVIVRFAPEPPITRFPFGTSDGLDEVAVTCNDAAGADPRFPKLKLIGPLELPGGIRTSAMGEIWPAKARQRYFK